MPTTANGTDYTTFSAAITGHGTVYWTVGDGFASEPNLPTILFAHGSGGAANFWATSPLASGIREAWIDGGGLVIEGGGGNTDSSGAQNWGNDEARLAYLAYLAYVAGILSVGDVVLVGRSMGGLVTAWLCAQSGVDFAGWINMSGVSTMLVGSSDNTAPVVDKNTVRHFGGTLWGAYGAGSYAAAAAAVNDEYSPEDWDASLWAGKSILSLYGDADTTVPLATRGAGPLRTIWAGLPAIDRLILRPGGDHGTNSTWLNVSDMVTFLAEVTSFTPYVPPNAGSLLATGRYAFIGGKHYALTPGN